MIVVDASVVVDALTLVEGSDALRDEISSEDLHAPSLLDFEVTSAVRGLTLGGKLSEQRGLRWRSGSADPAAVAQKPIDLLGEGG